MKISFMRIKKILTSILALWMAVLVVYGGAGVNILSFCCHECRSMGVEAILLAQYRKVHDHQAPAFCGGSGQEEDSSQAGGCGQERRVEVVSGGGQGMEPIKHGGCCAGSVGASGEKEAMRDFSGDAGREACDADNGGCGMTRIDFDWNAQNTAELEINLSPVALNLLHRELFVDALMYIPLIRQPVVVMSNGPPADTPRDYLSTLTVLLI